MPQYQGVWTLEQQAQAQSNQQWVTDPNFKNTTLLLQADGTGSGSQNNTFLDGSTNNFFITRNGNTTQGSFSPFSQAPGYWSNYFDGSSYLNTSSLAAMPSSFTVEGWVYITNTSTQRFVNGGFYLDIVTATGSNMKLQFYDGSTVTPDALNVIPINTWTHVALVRSGSGSNNCSFYVNGVRGTQFTCAVSFSSSTWQIGALSSFSQWFYGYISNLRFCNSAVYTGASFTPATATLTTTSQGASSCILLTCQSNRFLDNSATAATLTAGGSPSVQAFGPFAPALQWTPDVVGGSGYFDGTGDYLTVGSGTDVDLGTSDFMIEAWYYCLANGTYVSGVISKRVGGVASGWGMTTSGFVCDMAGTWYDSWANPFWVGSTQNSGFNSGTSLQKLNQWTHIVVTRQGTDARWFVNGQLLGYFSRTGAIQQLTGSPLAVGLNGTTSEQPFIGYISNVRVVVGSVPTGYQTSSTTLNTQIFTPPTSPVTTTSQSVTSGNIKYLGNYTNAGIYDGKMANNLETVGNAQVATSPVKYGSGSMYFSGSGNYLTSPYSPNLVFRTGDFTLECWLYWTGGAGENNVIMNNASGGFNLKLQATNAANWALENSYVGQLADFGTAPTKNVWHHIAVTRASGTLRAFIDGVQVYSGANSTDFVNTAAWAIGGNLASLSLYMTGYLDDFRITKGVARYIANFTPPQQALPRQ